MKETGNIILYESSDGALKLEVPIDGDTVWLNAQQMGDLFGIDRSGIVKHVQNVDVGVVAYGHFVSRGTIGQVANGILVITRAKLFAANFLQLCTSIHAHTVNLLQITKYQQSAVTVQRTRADDDPVAQRKSYHDVAIAKPPE